MKPPVVLPREYQQLTVIDLETGETGSVDGDALRADKWTGALFIEDTAIVHNDHTDRPVLVARHADGWAVGFRKSFRVPIGITGTSNWLPVVQYETY